MSRKTFSDILKSAEINISREYERLYHLFFYGKPTSLFKQVETNFALFPYRGTCISLDDFNRTHKFFFRASIAYNDIDSLITFCEYSINLIKYTVDETNKLNYAYQITQVINKVGYTNTTDEKGVIIFVPKSVPAIEVASIAERSISYKVLQFNHHSMHGNLPEKLSILKQMADDLEPQRKELKTINGALEGCLFQMLQKFVRHNNNDNPYISNMTPQETEKAYDDIYQMWLIAKLELDNVERNKRVKELLGKINS